MDANRIWVLIGKKIAGNATPAELTELESLMAECVDNAYPLRELEEMWLLDNQPNDKTPEEIKEKWENFKKNLPAAKTQVISINKKKNNNYFFWLAASLVIAFCLVAIKLSTDIYNNNIDLYTSIVQAPDGSTSKITLPDGSKVWLNANSKLTYKKQFGQKYREVNLVGEAFFDVVKDAKHPFIVTTASLRLKVLGTAFNVRAFSTDKTSEAALVRGSIEVTLVNNPDKKLTLKPSEKIVVRNEPTSSVISTIREPLLSMGIIKKPQVPLITLTNIHYNGKEALPEEAQWMEKKLAFTSESFDDIAGRMERYYNVTIDFEDDDVKNLMFSGSFKGESINNAMKALQATGNFQYKITNNKITIYK
ncbi:MAG: FecR family protein [Mucilaginibacter sp.]